MIGAAILMARANGLSFRTFSDKLIQMCINNETSFGTGVAAAALGKQHPSGAWICEPVLANVTKVHTAILPYETKRIAQDISGGIAETGCMPSSRDFYDERHGHLVQKYLKAACSAETRARTARLVEWLTVGAGIPGCLHGGGSPEGAKVVIRANAGLERFVALAKRLADIEEDVPEPTKK